MNKLFAAEAVGIGIKKLSWNKTCLGACVEFFPFPARCRREGRGWEEAEVLGSVSPTSPLCISQQ